MEEVINGKAIYTPKGAALEYGRVGCNFYTGCYHDCGYCYLKRGAPSKVLGGTEVKLKKCFKDEDHAWDVLCQEGKRHIDTLRQTGIFFSFTTDPMIPETINLTMWALEWCIAHGIPAKTLTKNAQWVEAPGMGKLFNLIKDEKADIRFGFTLTGRDDMEPNASTNEARIEAMAKLKKFGLQTWASIEPVIDWSSSIRMVEHSLFYCDHYKIGLRSGVGKDYYTDIAMGFKTIEMVNMIVESGSTVYLKESLRKRLSAILTPKGYNELLSKTVDMDGNPIGNIQQYK